MFIEHKLSTFFICSIPFPSCRI